MTILLVFIVLAGLFLAYSNGANDTFKGVATLFGSGASTYKRALVWAVVTTLAGSLLAWVLAWELVGRFMGNDLVAPEVVQRHDFQLAAALGAALTVMLAAWLGIPVSTTHALMGGLVGAGLLAAGGQVHWAYLGQAFVLPLLASPVLAMLLTLMLYPCFRFVRRRLGITRRTCICVGTRFEEVTLQPDGTVALVRPGAAVQVWAANQCIERYQGHVLGLEAGPMLDGLHYLSSGAVGFARGLNDTPKIVAVLIAGTALPGHLGVALVAVLMATGGLLSARRVAETMSKKITRMNPGQGFTANLVTSLLVVGASRLGLPVSTTHVSVGSLFGIGLVSGAARARTIAGILFAWLATLPLGAALAAAVYLLLLL